MAIKKSELYSSIWKSCDELRGGMDASQYKDYVLVLLFVKYVSDKYANKPNAPIIVPKNGSFEAMKALKGQKDIGDKINKIISKLAEENDLKGVIDVADFNDPNKLGHGKEMQDKLSKLVAIFEDPALHFGKNGIDGDDLLGDAYEYLMRHFATESGKSKGQFYTPAEVSQVIAKVIGVNQSKSQSQTIYDPTCGSGSLLLKAADETPRGITIYGQEMDNATRALAKMNMILHNQPSADIQQGNTLANPKFKESKGGLKLFDFVVANPPFSTKSWSSGFDPLHDEYDRFSYGVPPTKNGDYAFMLHIIRSLKSTGKGAVILPHGVLFRGNVEADIRKNIIQKGYIKGIISLPPNLFYGTGIPACIIVLDKAEAAKRNAIFMIDASKGFFKDGNKNRLRHQDIHKIVDVFTKQIELPKYSRLVNIDEIEKNDFNLNIPRYIDNSEEEDIQDIGAHLFGGIPHHDVNALDEYWQAFPTLKKKLFTKGIKNGFSNLKITSDQIRHVIFEHPEFIDYTKEIEKVFLAWAKKQTNTLKNLDKGAKPKLFINELSESILQAFANVSLIDKYDIYQHLMTYWSDTMQDDVHLIASGGWKASEELIPASIIINHYFEKEQKNLEQLEIDKENVIREKEEIEEEHGGEDGLFEELKSDKGKISKGAVQKQIKGIHKDPDAKEEHKILSAYMKLIDKEAALNKAIKEGKSTLDQKVAAKYAALSKDEIKSLVVDDKWLAAIHSDVISERDRISQALTQRIKTLAERYSNPLPTLVTNVKELSKKVDAHLAKMGFDMASIK